MKSQTNPHDIVRTTFADSEENWKKFLFDGYLADSAAKPVGAKFNATIPELKSAAPTAGSLEVVFYRDAKMDDGRYANNGWMQELPDPITKLTWDNAVLVSRKTARELGVQNGDVVEIDFLPLHGLLSPHWRKNWRKKLLRDITKEFHFQFQV